MLKVLAVIQFWSRGEWRNLPYLAISPAFSHSEVQKDCQNRKREIGYMPLVNCPFLKPVYFKPLFSMWLWFSPNEEGGEGGERELIYCPPCFCRVCGTAGIWTPECGIQFNSQPFSFCYLWKIISHSQYFFVSLFLKL